MLQLMQVDKLHLLRLTVFSYVVIAWISVYHATHRYPLADRAAERLRPGGGWRQHTGPGGGLLLCVQSGTVGGVRCHFVVHPQRGATTLCPSHQLSHRKGKGLNTEKKGVHHSSMQLISRP